MVSEVHCACCKQTEAFEDPTLGNPYSKQTSMGWRIPKGLNSDNVTQSSSIDFADFCKSWDIQHISLHYPQSNGAAERAVGTAEHILHQHVSQLALLSYRATPITATGANPCSGNAGMPNPHYTARPGEEFANMSFQSSAICWQRQKS